MRIVFYVVVGDGALLPAANLEGHGCASGSSTIHATTLGRARDDGGSEHGGPSAAS